MCIVNGDEVRLTIRGWSELFPDGVPLYYTATDGMIDIEASLPNIKKESVNDFRRWAMSRNAAIAAQIDSCRISGAFPLLTALLGDECTNTEK